MTLIWPETLPQQPVKDRYSEQLAATTLRTAMDQGPAKLRQRTTAGVATLEAGYLLTGTIAAVLEQFYTETLRGGSLSFIYPHPRRKTPVMARFRQPPEIMAQSGRYYLARVMLEILPQPVEDESEEEESET